MNPENKDEVKIRTDPPEGWGADSVSDFIKQANYNGYCTFANQKSAWKRLVLIDQIFRGLGDNLSNPQQLVPAFLFFQTHSSFLGAVRLSTSCQVPEAYAVMRRCLENALYGYFLSKRQELCEVWLRRHESEEMKQRVKDAFKIGLMMRLLESENRILAKITSELYERTIDHGAHPNERALLQVLRREEKEGGIRFGIEFLSGDSPHLGVCVKTNAQVGVLALDLFYLVFKQRFDLLGLTALLRDAKEDL